MKEFRFPVSAAMLAVTALLGGCATTGDATDNTEDDANVTVEAAGTETATSASLGYLKVGKPYKVRGKWYTPKHVEKYSKEGLASWYGPNFNGGQTANGEVYDMNHLSAAHKTLPLPSYVRVTNLKNDSSVIVRVNDRGPFVSGRIIDLSKKAAEMLDMTHEGVADVRVDYVGPAPRSPDDMNYLLASYETKPALPAGVDPARMGDAQVQIAQIKTEEKAEGSGTTLLALAKMKSVPQAGSDNTSVAKVANVAADGHALALVDNASETAAVEAASSILADRGDLSSAVPIPFKK
nr:septal ring lytic transglycosylase RlpA family protein [Marinicella sp. W31]MDC2877047.1 septal ring lytic transglycosylase RlpA family protein [Marinicella sp. W31]